MANILDYLRWRGDLHWQASPLNDVDLLILPQLSYVNFDAQLGGEGRMDQRRGTLNGAIAGGTVTPAAEVEVEVAPEAEAASEA